MALLEENERIKEETFRSQVQFFLLCELEASQGVECIVKGRPKPVARIQVQSVLNNTALRNQFDHGSPPHCLIPLTPAVAFVTLLLFSQYFSGGIIVHGFRS